MQAPLTIELTTPAGDDRPIYLAGTCNDWQVGQENYRFKKIGPGRFRLAFPAESSITFPLEFKLAREDWSGEETDRYGSAVRHHRLEAPTDLFRLKVPRWKRHGIAHRKELLPQIQVIDEAFEIPQLIKTRRIAALLPHNYHQSDKRYPVLYLQDGQNLFDEYAPFGNWELDKKLAVMAELGIGDLIVVAIDHAEKDRIVEYTPSYPTRLGPGDGKKYARFLADTLKPYIDKHFRTRPEREYTGIGGSSMGGLISIYTGVMYPEVYGRQMILSPSLWVAPEIYNKALQVPITEPTHIYVYTGGRESENMIPLTRNFCRAMQDKHPANMELELRIDPLGEHREGDWGRAFPEAARWLFFPE